jgi:hypothetical protein
MCGSPADQEVGPRGVETGYLYSDTACRRISTSSQELIRALDFRFETTRIAQTTGPIQSNDDTSFNEDVLNAEVCIKSFKLEYVGGPRPSDVVQVTARLQRFSGKQVEYTVTTNYSGGPYTGEVTVLVIADVKRPAP